MSEYKKLEKALNYFDKGLSSEDSFSILWQMTSFPFFYTRELIYQFRSAIRKMKKGLTSCDKCFMSTDYCSHLITLPSGKQFCNESFKKAGF